MVEVRGRDVMLMTEPAVPENEHLEVLDFERRESASCVDFRLGVLSLAATDR